MTATTTPLGEMLTRLAKAGYSDVNAVVRDDGKLSGICTSRTGKTRRITAAGKPVIVGDVHRRTTDRVLVRAWLAAAAGSAVTTVLNWSTAAVVLLAALGTITLALTVLRAVGARIDWRRGLEDTDEWTREHAPQIGDVIVVRADGESDFAPQTFEVTDPPEVIPSEHVVLELAGKRWWSVLVRCEQACGVDNCLGPDEEFNHSFMLAADSWKLASENAPTDVPALTVTVAPDSGDPARAHAVTARTAARAVPLACTALGTARHSRKRSKPIMSQTAPAPATLVEVTLGCGHLVAAPKTSNRPATCPNRCNDSLPDHRRSSIRPRTRS